MPGSMASKTLKFTKKILLNYLILQISTILNVLFCQFRPMRNWLLASRIGGVIDNYSLI